MASLASVVRSISFLSFGLDGAKSCRRRHKLAFLLLLSFESTLALSHNNELYHLPSRKMFLCLLYFSSLIFSVMLPFVFFPILGDISTLNA